MGGEVLVFICMILVVFGIAYLFFSTRNKERMALIEKGAEARIFAKGNPANAAPIWKILTLNLSLLLMGIGSGIMIGGILSSSFGVEESIAMPGAIFLMAGSGLLIGFFLIRKMEKPS